MDQTSRAEGEPSGKPEPSLWEEAPAQTDTKPEQPLRFIRIGDVLERLPISRSSFWDGIRKGKYPKPRHIGRIAVWSTKEIDDLLNSIDAGR